MTDQRIACFPYDHDFVIKKQVQSSTVVDTTEVYCRKCGTVCFLSPPQQTKEEIMSVYKENAPSIIHGGH